MKPKSNEKARREALQDLLAEAANRKVPLLHRDRDWSVGRTLERIARGEDPGGFLGGAGSTILVTAATEATRDGWTDQPVRTLSGAMSYLYFNARYFEALGAPKADTEGHVADHAGTAVDATLWATLLYAHFGQWDRARWLAAYLLGYFNAGSVRGPSKATDPECHELARVLLQALADDRWPDRFAAELGPYQPLLDQRRQAGPVADALVRVMDFRMARWLGYAQVDDAKPLPPSKAGFMFGGLTYAAIPADLWAFQALSRRLDGFSPSLEAGHPWLAAAFMTPPAGPLPEFDDDVLQQLRQLGDSRFDPGWRE